MIPFETKGGTVSFDDCITLATEKLREASELLLRAGHIENSHNRTDRGEWFKKIGMNLEQTAKLTISFANQPSSRVQ
jgi:hypothetical protein